MGASRRCKPPIKTFVSRLRSVSSLIWGILGGEFIAEELYFPFKPPDVAIGEIGACRDMS